MSCAATGVALINIVDADPLPTQIALAPPLLKNIGENLHHLSLVDCGLEGTIPAAFGTLCPNLQELGLASNPGLTGSIPSSIGSLKFLIKLFLNRNNLTGSVPASLVGLKVLFKLYLFGNQLDPVEDAPLTSADNPIKLQPAGSSGQMRYETHPHTQAFLASLKESHA